MVNDLRHKRSVQPVSDQELARFLRQLSVLYNNKITGNPALGVALSNLAESLSRNHRGSDQSQDQQQTSFWNTDLKSLNRGSVYKLLEDTNLTKSDLVKIGSERFSIPRSRLLRLTVEEVRNEVISAVKHEESIQIISQEALRGGANRVS